MLFCAIHASTDNESIDYMMDFTLTECVYIYIYAETAGWIKVEESAAKC